METRTYFISAAVAGLFVFANWLTKKSLDEGYAWLTPLVFILGGLAFLTFRFVCRDVGLAVASSVVDSLLLLGTLLVAYVVLGEQLSAIKWAGVVLIVVGLFLVR